MTDSDIAYWSTVAQISAVLALVMTVEYARAYRVDHPDRGWKSYKLGATVGIASGLISVAFALFTSVSVLRTGSFEDADESRATSGLTVGFIVAVGWPALGLLFRIWTAGGDPDNPEPPSLIRLLGRRKKRSQTKPSGVAKRNVEADLPIREDRDGAPE
ncbi:MAG TPA: hypothetical protein VL294_13295 [Pseudolysinimonas sp.]|jgi:hypothetical protein|nr:hypothetical protein [Pseudolysinimonas sp.]